MSYDAKTVGEIAARPPVFVVGCPRSGTTLLQVMLDTHPGLSIAHEGDFVTDVAFDPRFGEWSLDESLERSLALERFQGLELDANDARKLVAELAPGSYAEVARILFAARAAKHHKARWGNKSPHQLFHLDRLAGLFPDAQFVHIIRDGRECAVSWASMRPERSVATVYAGALLWRHAVRAGAAAGRRLGTGRYFEIHLEQLVAEPRATLASVCDFLEVDFSEQMIDYRATARSKVPKSHQQFHPAIDQPLTAGLRDWRSGLTAREQRSLEVLLRQQLEALDYGVAPPARLAPGDWAGAASAFVLGSASEAWANRHGLRRELLRRQAALASSVRRRRVGA